MAADALTWSSRSAEETTRLGRAIGAACIGGEVVLLEGELGAGKTTLTRGIAEGLGVESGVVSPTFILMREYEGRLPLYHFDFYRLEGAEREVDVEFGDYFAAGGVCVVEWPSHAPAVVPDGYLRVGLAVCGESERALSLSAVGAAHSKLLADIAAGIGAA